jgi:uncharacterized protein (TIGR03067 family)
MRTTCLLLALAGVASAAAQEPNDKGAKEELAKLEGTWRLVSGETDRRKVPQEDIKDVSMVIRGDRATVSEGKQTSQAGIRVNAAAKPKQIDTKYLSGPEKGFTALGIYELDGDTLRICHTSKATTKRPEKFETAENSRLVLAVWKREKK